MAYGVPWIKTVWLQSVQIFSHKNVHALTYVVPIAASFFKQKTIFKFYDIDNSLSNRNDVTEQKWIRLLAYM